jgi:hypothetical protein
MKYKLPYANNDVRFHELKQSGVEYRLMVFRWYFFNTKNNQIDFVECSKKSRIQKKQQQTWSRLYLNFLQRHHLLNTKLIRHVFLENRLIFQNVFLNIWPTPICIVFCHLRSRFIVNSNMPSFFRFVKKWAIYRLAIISLAHAPVHVTDFPVVNSWS